MIKIKAQKVSGNVWFTADLHFGHTNILKFCPKTRPFQSAKEMDEKLVKDWNELIQPDDIVYVLGDVRFTTERIENRLQGKKHLILGNHDKSIHAEDWESVQYYKEINIDGQIIVMFHYPISTWNRQHYGALHLHGHTHGNNHGRPDTAEISNRYDVGVDATGRVAVSLREIQQCIH